MYVCTYGPDYCEGTVGSPERGWSGGDGEDVGERCLWCGGGDESEGAEVSIICTVLRSYLRCWR